jgi:hypothetical protein
MYGLESTVMLALHNGCIAARRPFYPADIRRALEQARGGRVLITTPVHLRALLEEERQPPALQLIVCATAPCRCRWPPRRSGATPRRCWRSTAYRGRSGRHPPHRCSAAMAHLPGARLRAGEGGVWFGGGHVEVEALASDVIEALDAERFSCTGAVPTWSTWRKGTARLSQPPARQHSGVEDGVYFLAR